MENKVLDRLQIKELLLEELNTDLFSFISSIVPIIGQGPSYV